jgi:hypothetical protein
MLRYLVIAGSPLAATKAMIRPMDRWGMASAVRESASGRSRYPVRRSSTRGRRSKSTITTHTIALTSAAVDATSFPIFASGWGSLVM